MTTLTPATIASQLCSFCPLCSSCCHRALCKNRAADIVFGFCREYKSAIATNTIADYCPTLDYLILSRILTTGYKNQAGVNVKQLSGLCQTKGIRIGKRKKAKGAILEKLLDNGVTLSDIFDHYPQAMGISGENYARKFHLDYAELKILEQRGYIKPVGQEQIQKGKEKYAMPVYDARAFYSLTQQQVDTWLGRVQHGEKI